MWRPRQTTEAPPLRLSSDPDWYDDAVRLSQYRIMGTAVHITAVRSHVMLRQVGTNEPHIEARVDGVWCPVCTLTETIHTGGEWRQLFADQTDVPTAKITRSKSE